MTPPKLTKPDNSISKEIFDKWTEEVNEGYRKAHAKGDRNWKRKKASKYKFKIRGRDIRELL